MQDRHDKKLKNIWLTPEENKNWDPKSIHLILTSTLTFAELKLAIKVYTEFKQNKLGLVKRDR